MSAPVFYFDRIREKLRQRISDVITNEVRDPRIQSVITVININLSPDTRNATVFVSVYGDEKEKKSALIALNHAAPFIQCTVSQSVKMKHFPRIYFKLDESIERGQRIEQLFKENNNDLD